MENGWPMKCSAMLPSSTAMVASPAMAKHIQPQETRNQMNINMGHSIHPRDAQEPRLISPGMKPAPAVSNMLNFGSCKPVHHETGNSFLSLLSASPSFLQYDFQQQSNLKSSWGNYPAKSAPNNAGTIPRSLMHNNGNLNPAPAVDVHPVYPSRPTVNSNKYRSCGLYDDLDALRALITRASSRNENDSGASHRKSVNCAPRSTADGEMSRGSNSNVMLESSLQTSSSVAKKHIPVVRGCPRVFCMGACGDLLASNTGLLGILCSCHGQHMSVSNFCKHSGLPDVNPGYAVRMGNGESVAQWRKQYLQKFGIRAPEDHRGWDWPEVLLTNSGLAKSSMAEADRSKVFDLSSLFTSSAEPVKSSRPWNNVSTSQPQSIHEYANQMSKAEQRENGRDQCSFFMSSTGSSGRNSHDMIDNPTRTLPLPSCLVTSRVSGRGGSRDDCQSRSSISSIISRSDNSFSSSFQYLQSVGSKTDNNLEDDIVLQRGTLSSSTELKLGQPTQPGWGSRSTSLPDMRSNIRDFQTTNFQQQLTHNLGNSKVIEHYDQHLHGHPASDLSSNKKEFQLDPRNNALSTTNGASRLVHLKDELSNNFVIPIASSNTSAGGSNAHRTKNNKGVKESHHFIPCTPHSWPHVDRSAVIGFPSDEGDGPIRASDTDKSVLQKNKNSTVNTRCEYDYSNVGSESNFRRYVKQMENSGFFTTNGKTCHLNSCTVSGEKFNSLQMASMLPDIYCASNTIENVCSLGSSSEPDGIYSPYGFRMTQTLPPGSSGSTPLAVILEPGHAHASLNKDVNDVNPHRSDESLRALALRKADKSFKEKAADASNGLNQRIRTDSDQRQQSKNCSISDLRVLDSFLDPGPSEGINEHPFSVGHSATPTFLSDTGGKKASDIRKGTNAEGTNNWEDLEVCIRRMLSVSEVTDKYYQGPCGHQPAKQPSLSLGGGKNKASGFNMVQRCFEGSYTYFSGMCHCTAQTIYPNRELDSEATCFCLKNESRMGVVETPKLNGSKLADVSVPIEKATLVECNRKVKKQLDGQRESLSSQWRDVPSKVNPVAKLRFPNPPQTVLDKSGEAESHLGEFGAKVISTPDQVADLKGKELSSVSSGCSAPAVTQASVEVNKTDSFTVDGGDTGYANDQIADQGSAIDRSWSSVDAIESVKSSQNVFCGKVKSTEEESLAVLPNVVSHGVNQELKQRHSQSKELQYLSDSGASFGEVSNMTQKHENESKPRKRKRPITVSAVSSLPSESPPHANKCDAADKTYTSADVQVLLQSNQDSSNMAFVDMEARVIKRRSGLSSVKMLPCKRDVNGMYNMVKDDPDDQRQLKGNDDSLAIPENVVPKRLKQVKPTESLITQVQSDESLKCSLKCCQKATLDSDENVGNQKARPVASGKYGIICNQESDIDQLKPPKIVPLSQVLKSSRTLAKFKSRHKLPAVRNVDRLSGGRKYLDGSFSSSAGQGSLCNDAVSCKVGDHDTSSNETPESYHIEDENAANDLSVQGRVGANGRKRNLSVSSCHLTAQSKPKEIRTRSLYELSTRGKEFIFVNVSLSQNLMCAPSTECEWEKKASGDAGKHDFDKCKAGARRFLEKPPCNSLMSELDALCCVCGISNKDDTNRLLKCGHCLIQIHQACYGIARVPKDDWYCRPCRTSSKDVACVLCGYGGGAMTRAFGSRDVVKSLLKAWNIQTESHIMGLGSAEALCVPAKMECENKLASARFRPPTSVNPGVHNSIISGLYDRTVKQWVHMVCGLWTPGTRCPNVDTMSAFDVSGVSHPKVYVVCYLCKRRGGSCIRCRVDTCKAHFHPWCAHQKGLLQSEVEEDDNHKIGFYGQCLFHANQQTYALESDDDTDKTDSETERENQPTCARTEGYKGKKQEYGRRSSYRHTGKGGSLVNQVQLDAWLYINRRKLYMKRLPINPDSDADHDYRKEYARYKQAKGWKQLVVYKSGIHALGLYTSQFIPHGAMVVEYIGEIVGLRVADKREAEYLSGRRLQYKSACYFFRIDKEHIIDATCKGGIARFVNHSCQPNCVAKVMTVRSEKKVVFFAERDIYPGEEVTYDYHFNNEDEGKKIPCLCNSRNCRRFLN